MQRHWGIKVSDVFKKFLKTYQGEELWSLGEIIAGQGEGYPGTRGFEYFLRVLVGGREPWSSQAETDIIKKGALRKDPSCSSCVE